VIQTAYSSPGAKVPDKQISDEDLILALKNYASEKLALEKQIKVRTIFVCIDKLVKLGLYVVLKLASVGHPPPPSPLVLGSFIISSWKQVYPMSLQASSVTKNKKSS